MRLGPMSSYLYIVVARVVACVAVLHSLCEFISPVMSPLYSCIVHMPHSVGSDSLEIDVYQNIVRALQRGYHQCLTQHRQTCIILHTYDPLCVCAGFMIDISNITATGQGRLT